MKLTFCLLIVFISLALAQVDREFVAKDSDYKTGQEVCYQGICPQSCIQIKARFPDARSGQYYITIQRGLLRVYCEMTIAGGGYTFLPKIAASVLTDYDVQRIFTKTNQVLLRIWKQTGLQTYTTIKQLHSYKRYSLTFKTVNSTSRNFGFPLPQNHRLGNGLYLAILPENIARAKSTQGFLSNERPISFRNCDANPNSYFAFYENALEKRPSRYFSKNLIFEKQGVAVNWRQSAIGVFSLHQIPSRYFFFTELHFGGCGTYTSSDRWNDALGTAVGLR